MKKNTHPHNALPMADLHPSLDENPIIHWFVQNGKTLLYLLMGLLLLLVIGYRFIWGKTAKSEVEFLKAQNDFAIFQKEPAPSTTETQDNALQNLLSLLERHPELHPKYDGLLAQTLLMRNKIDSADKLEKGALERTKQENAPLFTDYAETTLLIAQNHYPEALQRALALKEKLSQEENSILFALNLLRIASLQQQLGLAQDELKTWQQWKQSAESPAFQTVNQLFTFGRVTLLNYIEAKEKI